MNEALLFFFDRRPQELSLYLALQERILARWPDADIEVRKTQISLHNNCLFACVSLPRTRAQRQAHGLILSICMARPLESPRVRDRVSPYPGRWTNHVPFFAVEEIDEELTNWLEEAWAFAARPGGRRRRMD